MKILFTTPYIKNFYYDYLYENSRRRFFRFSWPRTASPGLRFIKQNIPEIEILEYPTWEEYKRMIKKTKPNILGFSFYTNDIPVVLKMIEFARKNGVKE
ncbi:MAG: radical SAM protein, partial [Candidatus Aenigmarchaeota archaeon]|nr:radical SAM protein [Candidatus Aenigmarchaeota archaeon]